MLKRFLLYGMPIYILLVEQGIRSLLSHIPGRAEDTSILLSGPTITVGGLSLILATLTPKPVPLPQGAPANAIAINKSDKALIDTATICVFVFFLLWAYSIYLTHPNPPSMWALVIGILTYAIGIIFTEVKEVI